MLADREQAEEKARHGRELARKEGAEQVVIQTIEGDPAETLIDTAKDFGADLIVVGARGLGGVKRLLLGSVSEEVLRAARCPVLIGKGTRSVAGGR